MLHLSIEISGFSYENVALQGGLRGGYYGGYFEYHVIRDMSYGVWTDARYKLRRDAERAKAQEKEQERER